MEDDEFQIMQFMSYDTPMIDASERSIVKDGLARICCVALFSFFQGSIFFSSLCSKIGPKLHTCGALAEAIIVLIT